jgi:hypothetical protein
LAEKLAPMRIFYQPLSMALVSLASENFADQEKIQKIVNLLNGLRASLVDNKRETSVAYDKEREENSYLVAQYTGKINQLSNVVIP